MIYIDFIGGSHGNFLEVICNLAAGIETEELPFNNNGASHNKTYLGKKLFESNHYTAFQQPLPGNRLVAIRITENDLLPLSQISFLRAGDFGYDNNYLEKDTYNKLSNTAYTWVLNNLIQSFFENQIKRSYDAIKDPSWPDIATIDQFEQLPNWIKLECKNLHNLELLELSSQRPDCPRHVLREFFQIGFENPSIHGFMQLQSKMIYPETFDVYWFDYAKFYSNEFLDEIKKLADWAQLVYTTQHKVKALHDRFLAKQPYKDSKHKCDNIVKEIIQGQKAPQVNLLEESYINAELKRRGYECRY